MKTVNCMWLLRGVCLCFLSYFTAAETLNSTNTCLTNKTGVIQLTCNPGEMIHVVSFLYQTASDCNTVDGDCQVLQQSSDDVMLPSCNGQQTCEEMISNGRINETCNHTSPVYVTLSYECISESPVDVCAEISQTFSQQLYLISPDYLNKQDDFPSVPCACALSGSDMIVEILEVNLPFFPLEDRANITLLGDSGSWSSDPVPNALQYNKLVLNQTENVALFYDATGKNKQHMLLRLKGKTNITVQCNQQSTTTSTITSKTPTPTTSPPAQTASPLAGTNTSPASVMPVTESSSVENSSNSFLPRNTDTSNITAIAVGSVFAVIVVMVIVVVLVFIMMRRKRLKPYLGSKDKLDEGYSSPRANSEDNLHTYALNLAALEASDNQSSDGVPSPSSHQYFELEPYARQRSSSIVESSRPAAEAPHTNSNEQPSGLPYTNKKLEELYAKVIPKKFRSTKEMREKKGKEKEKKVKKKSKSSVNSDGYESIDVAGKHPSKKSRASSSKSDHDYQDIDSIRPVSDSVFVPPVPPKMDGIEEELDTTPAKIVNGDSRNTASEESSHTPEPSAQDPPNMNEIKEELDTTLTRTVNDDSTNKASAQTSSSKSNCKSSSDKDDDVVMVDNVLYEKGSPKEIKRSKPKTSQGSAPDGHYSSIPADDNVPERDVSGLNQSKDKTRKKENKPDGVQSKHESCSSDNGFVMVDNVLYEGGPAKEEKNEGTVKRTSNEYEDISKFGGGAATKPTIDTRQRNKSSPYEEIII